MNSQFLLHPILFNHWKSFSTLNSTSCLFPLPNHPLPRPPFLPTLPFSFFQKPPASFSQPPFPTGIKHTALSTGNSNPYIFFIQSIVKISMESYDKTMITIFLMGQFPSPRFEETQIFSRSQPSTQVPSRFKTIHVAPDISIGYALYQNFPNTINTIPLRLSYNITFRQYHKHNCNAIPFDKLGNKEYQKGNLVGISLHQWFSLKLSSRAYLSYIPFGRTFLCCRVLHLLSAFLSYAGLQCPPPSLFLPVFSFPLHFAMAISWARPVT